MSVEIPKRTPLRKDNAPKSGASNRTYTPFTTQSIPLIFRLVKRLRSE